MTDPALQALLDKQEIAELLTRYLRSVDRGDVEGDQVGRRRKLVALPGQPPLAGVR